MTCIGGHERVKDQIVEDKAISEQVKWNGYRLVVADGYAGGKHTHVHIPARHVGRLDEEYLSWLARSSRHVVAGCFGALLALIAALFLPVWPLLGLCWFFNGGGWMA